MTSGPPDPVVDLAVVSANGSAPRCEHLDGLPPAAPQSSVCLPCQAQDQAWLALLCCLTCGWVACSDRSPGRHAAAHYEETDHPVAAELSTGHSRRWCYVHRRTV